MRVNQLATAWLIRCVIDPQAIFLFVEPVRYQGHRWKPPVLLEEKRR
ncbi:MAG: hypothetical protein HOP18_26120 [Deltaproteobacteria bacterium]|nr:hypothetical protein [Deltaproteobacteria bacterium]